MNGNEPTLHLVCGKIAAGKSTLTTKLGALAHSVVVREDYWLARLYPGEQNSLADYVRNSTRLRAAMGPFLVDLLKAGLSVVLDFPANTRVIRSWMRTLIEGAGVSHQLHYLDVADEVCKSRLRQRNIAGEHDFVVTDEQFVLFTSHFEAPTPDEGFNIVLH
jgi:predicted kinase